MSDHVSPHFFYVFKDCINRTQECIDICKDVDKSCISKKKIFPECALSQGKCVVSFDELISACEICKDHFDLHIKKCKSKDCATMHEKAKYYLDECINASEECEINCKDTEELSVDACENFIKKGKDCIDICSKVIEFMSKK